MVKKQSDRDMNNALISVIIPVYNVEKYLERCVLSVRHQTLEEIEIILVDDGSPDKCPELCDEYALLDERIKVIHKTNGGLASARNAGLQVASGEFIFFLDSDDWLELDGLELLYDTALKYDVDFVRYRAIRSYWPGLEQHAPGRVEDVREMSGGYYDYGKIKESIYPRLITTSQLTMGPIVAAWSSLYRSDFLERYKIRFDEQVKFSEDMIFSAKVVMNAKSFYYIEEACVYHYFYNPASISKSFRAGRWESCKHLIELIEETFADNSEYDFSKQFVYLRWFCTMLGLNERKFIKDSKERKSYCKLIVNDPIVRNTKLCLGIMDVSLKQKIILILIKLKFVSIIEKI